MATLFRAKKRVARAAIAALLIALAGDVAACSPPQSTTVAVRSALPARGDTRVTIERVHHFEIPLRHALRVPSTVEITGTIDKLPYNAEIRAAVTCQANGPWHLIGGRAFIAVNGTWRFPNAVLEPAPAGQLASCQLMAFVADPMSETIVDQQTLDAKAYHLSTVVDLEVDPRLNPKPASSLVIDSVGGQSRGQGHLFVPWQFGMRGSSHGLPSSTELVALAACDRSPEWHALTSITPNADGRWLSSPLTLPRARPGMQCTLAVIAAETGTVKPTYSSTELAAHRGARSETIHLTQRPLFLSLRSITDDAGALYAVDQSVRDRETDAIALEHEIAIARIAGDVLPWDVKVFIAVQPAGSARSLLFGPATLQAPGTWILDNARVVMPALNVRGRRMRAVASRDALHGRALTAAELQAVTLGASEIVQVTAPAPKRCASVTGRVSQVNGGAEFVQTIMPPAPVVHLEGELRGRCPDLSGWLAIGGGPNRRWHLTRLTPNREGRWRTTITLPFADDGEAEPAREVAIVVAPEAFDATPIDETWLDAFAAANESTSLVVRLLPAPSRTWTRWDAVTGGHAGMPPLLSISKVAALTFVLILATVAVAWVLRRVPSVAHACRDWFNGVRDGRAGIARHPHAGTAYEGRLCHELAEARAQVERRFKPRIEALRSKLEDCRRRSTDLATHLRAMVQGSRRIVQSSISRFMHHTSLALMTASEVPFNLVAFRVLDEPDLFTVVMSTSFSIALPISAYWAGLTARRWEARSRHVTALLIATLGTISVALWAINEIRVAHLSNVAPGFVEQHPALSLAFIPVNVLIVLAAALLAFLYHDSVEGFAEATRKHDRLEKVSARFAQAIARKEARLAAERVRLDAHYGARQAFYLSVYERYRPAASSHRAVPATRIIIAPPPPKDQAADADPAIPKVPGAPASNGNGHSTGADHELHS
jgi:hypothetical protein